MTANTTQNATGNQFGSYKATLTNHEGHSSKCLVVNARTEVKFQDGTSGAAFKVRPINLHLVQGGHRYAENYANPIWVKAARVIAVDRRNS